MRSYYHPRLVSSKPARASTRQTSLRNEVSRPRIPPQVATDIRQMCAALGQLTASLAASGLRWDDIAAALAPEQPELWETRQQAPQDNPDGVRWIPNAELVELVAEIRRRAPPASGGRSHKFLAGLLELAADYPRVRLSAKQNAWLTGLMNDAGLGEAEHGGQPMP